MRITGLFVAIFFLACGGAQDSGLLDGGSGDDGGNNDAVATDGGTCDISHCATVPTGFTVVTLLTKGDACPSGWTKTDDISAPVASSGACSCNCNVTQQPNCNTGNVTRYFDSTSGATCTIQGTTFTANSGGCDPIGGNLYLNQQHYAVDAPPASAGACSWNAKSDDGKVSTTPARLCTPPASCLGAVCGSNVCVSQQGDVACPTGFPTKTLVGTGATAGCSTCDACTTGGECTGKLGFFTNSGCTMNEVDFTANGTCSANPASNIGPYAYYSFTGSLKAPATCSGTPPTSTATPTLTSAATVCCQN